MINIYIKYLRKLRLLSGFSLIELMVVIAIVAILSVIAVPAYKDYMIKTSTASSLKHMFDLGNEQMLQKSTTGTFNNNLYVNGVDVPQGVWTEVDFGNIHSILRLYDESLQSVMLVGLFSGLEGIDGYLSPPNYGPYYNQIAVASRVMGNGVTKTVCGPYSMADYGPYYVPAVYLPTNCSCLEVNSFFTGVIDSC